MATMYVTGLVIPVPADKMEVYQKVGRKKAPPSFGNMTTPGDCGILGR